LLNNSTELPFPERYIPVVTVGFCQTHGQFFKAVDKRDLEAIRNAKKAADRIALPEKESLRVLGGPKSSDLLTKKIPYYSDLFTPRQLLYVSAAKALLNDMEPKHRLWLALLVSTSLEFNSVLCGYKGSERRRPGAIRHVFSHHAYSFPYTSLENNPVFSQKTSGTLRRLFDDRIKDAGVWAIAPLERKPKTVGWRKIALLGEVDGGSECSSVEEFVDQERRFILEQRDSSRMSLPDESVDYVVTDPPYFDSVQYSDLSHYFRVWLQWFLPNDADWKFAPVSSAVAETEANKEKYRVVLREIWRECNRVLRRPHGRLIFTFHHWRADAWIQLTLALKASSFRLVTSYTVHSENPISVHIRHLRALKHDSILVLQPKELGSAASKFSPKASIGGDDSFNFCRDCADLLGYCLDSDHSDSEINRIWRAALGE
jgi:putative DNA methylase